MFGTNQVRPAEGGDGSYLQVAEIFYTIQGEGPFFGMPAVFVRLTGCNLRCWFCDTKWDDENDPRQHLSEVMHRINQASAGRTKLVVITGGEPLRQPLDQLITYLRLADYAAQIETAGTYWQDCLTSENVTIVCSPKIKHVHASIKEHCQHWKYVIKAGEVSDVDGLPSGISQPLQKYGEPCRPPGGVTVWLSPCDEYDEVKNKANKQAVAEMSLRFGYRAQIQLHKELGLE